MARVRDHQCSVLPGILEALLQQLFKFLQSAGTDVPRQTLKRQPATGVLNQLLPSDSEILLMTVLSTRSQSDRRLCWQLPNLSLATVCVYVCAAFEVSG